MHKTMALAGALLLCTTMAPGATESAAEFFRKDRTYWSKGVNPAEPAPAVRAMQVPAHRRAVADKVARQVEARLGRQWVPTALKLAKIESGFNCRATGPRTRHGRAMGVFQVMPGSARALGYNPQRLHDCNYGIAAGVSHMESCLRAGVRTHNEMAKCHVAGTHGWRTRLNRSAERYKVRYVRMAAR